MLRDAALVWIRSNVPDQKVHAYFKQHFDEAAKNERNFYFAFGPQLTHNAKPYLMHCFCGELFVFEMTSAQAEAYKLSPGRVMLGMTKATSHVQCDWEPFVTVSDLEIERADNLSVNDPIVASFSYQTAEILRPCCVRLDYEVPGLRSTAAWHYLEQHLPQHARIRCEFGPVKKPGMEVKLSAPLAMFFRICTLPDSKNIDNRVPISNIIAGLVSMSQ